MTTEVNQIHSEYSTFFPSLTILTSTKLQFKTFEGESFIAEFTDNGWLINNELYESFENAASRLSNEFNKKFSYELCKKLEALKNLE